MKKYYTPEIEEFHVGFRCELKPHELKDWEGHIVTPKDKLDLAPYLDSKKIRVKYLDKEDIGELGWESTSDIGKWFINEHEYTLTYNPNFDKYEIRPWVPWWFSGSFLGVIKNKSELKKIMKQLKII